MQTRHRDAGGGSAYGVHLPTEFLGQAQCRGHIRPGYPAQMAIFYNEINVSAVVYAGRYETV